MNHTTNNSGDINFNLRQETREAGLVYRMYRNQYSIFVEVSLPISPESNDRKLRSFFLTVCSSARVYTNIKYCVCPGSRPGGK